MALVTIVIYDMPDGDIVLRCFTEPAFPVRDLDKLTPAQLAGGAAMDAAGETGKVESVEAVKGY